MPPTVPRAAKPTTAPFDPYNGSSTGHQRSDGGIAGSTSWRQSRTLKLHGQFGQGAGGGSRVSDTVGAGSLDFGQDGRTANGGWIKGAKGLRTSGQKSIWESMGGLSKDVGRPAKRVKVEQEEQKPTCVVNPWTPFRKPDGTIRESSWTSHELSPSHLLSPIDAHSFTSEPEVPQEERTTNSPLDPAQTHIKRQDDSLQIDRTNPQIFTNLTFYLNGSTAPAISDHKLKHLISEHGGRMSIALGRRTVTHVIIGRPNSSGGSGGGLAGSKIHKEITRVGGKGVKFVSVDFVTQSIEAGKRLPESRFQALLLAPKGVDNVAKMFGTNKDPARAATNKTSDAG